jgi:predicted cupin superfamily sugar epimerase
VASIDLDVADLIERFGLVPLPAEGGLFCQTYRSDILIDTGGPAGGRALATAILYLMTPGADGFSALHRLSADEIYHFYLGDAVGMLLLGPGNDVRRVALGQDVLHGEDIQFPVPRGVWQGCHLMAGGRFALLGTTMAPGYDPADFELGVREELVSLYPGAAQDILRLTR